MGRRGVSGLVLAAMLSTLGPAAAFDASDSNARHALALEMAELSTLAGFDENTIETRWLQVRHRLQATNPAMTEESLQNLRSLFILDCQAFVSQLEATVVDIYLNEFTADELKQMKAFSESPVGRKLVSLGPRISDQLMSRIESFWPRIASSYSYAGVELAIQ